MNGRLGLLAVAIAGLAAIPLQPVALNGQEASARFRVLVPEFQGQEGADRRFGGRLADELRDRINEMVTHQPIEERELKDALKQYDIEMEDLNCTASRQLASLINARVLFCGTYSAVGEDDLLVELRMITGDGEEFDLEPVTVPKRNGQQPAADHYAEALQVQSDQARYAQFCGDYASSSNWANAMEMCDQAIELNPNSTGSRYTRAVVLRNLDRFEDALEEFLRVLELDALNEDAMQYAGWLSATLGRDDDARMYYSQYLELNPSNAVVRMNVAHDLATAGDPLGAMIFIEDGIELDAENVDLLKQHGGFAYAAGADAMVGQAEITPEAEELLRKSLDSYGKVYALEGEGMDAGHLRVMLVVLRNLEEYQEAIDLAERVLQTHSEASDLWSVYADVLQRADRIDDAITALDRVVELDPEAANVKARQGNWLIQAGRLDDAIPILHEAAARGEQTADAVANMVWNDGYQNGIQTEDWGYALRVMRLARDFDITDDMTQQIDFWIGFAGFRSAAVAQEPNTLETANATLPRFQEALRLIQSAAAYANRAGVEATRQQVITQLGTFIEIQEAIIRRGR